MNNAKKMMMTLAKMMLKAQTKADFYLSNANRFCIIEYSV